MVGTFAQVGDEGRFSLTRGPAVARVAGTERREGAENVTEPGHLQARRDLDLRGPIITEYAPIAEADTAGVPRPIAADLLEASVCCAAGAYRGAGLLVRRAVEQVVVLRRVPLDRRTLDQKLAWLLQAGHLAPDLVADARVVRDLGNAAAHGSGGIGKDEAWAGVRAGLAVARGVLVR